MTINDTKSAADYTAITHLLNEFTQTRLGIAALEIQIQKAMQDIARQHVENLTALQFQSAELEETIRRLALRHPDWFKEKRTLSTPFGTVAMRRVTTLIIPDEEKTLRILAENEDLAVQFLRIKTEINREALDCIDDDGLLKKLKVHRETEDTVKITEAKAQTAKALKAAKEKITPAAPANQPGKN